MKILWWFIVGFYVTGCFKKKDSTLAKTIGSFQDANTYILDKIDKDYLDPNTKKFKKNLNEKVTTLKTPFLFLPSLEGLKYFLQGKMAETFRVITEQKTNENNGYTQLIEVEFTSKGDEGQLLMSGSFQCKSKTKNLTIEFGKNIEAELNKCANAGGDTIIIGYLIFINIKTKDTVVADYLGKDDLSAPCTYSLRESQWVATAPCHALHQALQNRQLVKTFHAFTNGIASEPSNPNALGIGDITLNLNGYLGKITINNASPTTVTLTKEGEPLTITLQ